MPSQVTATLSAEDTYSDALTLLAGDDMGISVSGTFTATVTLQRRIAGEDWRDTDFTYTAGFEDDYRAFCGQDVRIGIKAGAYTSGDAVVVLKRGEN